MYANLLVKEPLDVVEGVREHDVGVRVDDHAVALLHRVEGRAGPGFLYHTAARDRGNVLGAQGAK